MRAVENDRVGVELLGVARDHVGAAVRLDRDRVEAAPDQGRHAGRRLAADQQARATADVERGLGQRGLTHDMTAAEAMTGVGPQDQPRPGGGHATLASSARVSVTPRRGRARSLE